MSSAKVEKNTRLTPMMQQYQEIKSKHRDGFLFFRMGDFYEMFTNDAEKASNILDIALTSRNGIPMCGVPYHAYESYAYKLLKTGHKVIICEQTEDPAQAKGIVKREVVQVLTPGTIVDDKLLDSKQNNYLVCFLKDNKHIGFSYIDLSTGEFMVYSFPYFELRQKLSCQLDRLVPGEVILPESLLNEDPAIHQLLSAYESVLINRYPDWYFEHKNNRERLLEFYKLKTLKGFGIEIDNPGIIAAGVILRYVQGNCQKLLTHIKPLKIYEESEFLIMDSITQRNLELTRNLHDYGKKNTLYDTLDSTQTAMGGRLLKKWLLNPLKNKQHIEKRLEIVNLFYHEQILLLDIRKLLSGVMDLERLVAKIILERALPHDVISIKQSLKTIISLKNSLKDQKFLQSITDNLDPLQDIISLIENSIQDEPGNSVGEGNVIRSGFNLEFDEIKKISTKGRETILELEKSEKQKTGISSLKIKYNRIIGYFFEVTKPNLNLVPDHYIRRQSLMNADRFTTKDLSEYESKVLNAKEKLNNLEQILFKEILTEISGHSQALQKNAELVAVLDVLCAFAYTATCFGYTKPELQTNGQIKIEEGRHPVVEAMLGNEPFIANDLLLDNENNRLLLITGPNMAGKSTYLRQAALIVLMAQMGSFVPAREAAITLVDRIFTRIGASDNIARGESTFLVEMNETANILHNATDRSLIIMDEVGRGTSTMDGLSLAWAIAIYLVSPHYLGAKTLFATHFHELTHLEKNPGIRNYCLKIKEENEDILFLRKIEKGASSKSYGVHVAKLAGVPPIVIQLANSILKTLEKEESVKEKELPLQLDLFQKNVSPVQQSQIEQEILDLNLNNMTPMKALEYLYKTQKKLIKK